MPFEDHHDIDLTIPNQEPIKQQLEKIAFIGALDTNIAFGIVFFMESVTNIFDNNDIETTRKLNCANTC